jgi:hypothetical protein
MIIAAASFKIAQLQAFSNRLSRDNAIRAGHHLVIGPGDFTPQPAIYDQITILLQIDWRLPRTGHFISPIEALSHGHFCTTTPAAQTQPCMTATADEHAAPQAAQPSPTRPAPKSALYSH